MKKKALGKGLEALLGEVSAAYDSELSSTQNENMISEIEISLITPNPFQPRKYFDEEALSELSQSIEEHGLIQPIVVIRKDDGYTLIAGERRLRATKLLGETKIRAFVVDLEDKNLRELALIENIQRENLSPIELANSYKELIKEHGITQEELSNFVKKSRTHITNTLRLLNLNEKTQNLIDKGKITQGHAKIIVGLDNKDEDLVVNTIVGQNLNVRDTENLVKRIKNKKPLDADFVKKITELKDKIAKFGTNCKVSGKNLILNFDNVKELENIISKFK